MSNLIYLDSKEKFLGWAYLALQGRFETRDKFNLFFESIASAKDKDHFLRICFLYLFLVKSCSFILDITGSDNEVDYITNTYKYVSIFSLIEALYTKEKFVDFFSFMNRKKSQIEFPIENRDKLGVIHERYKMEYGSVQKAVKFFNSLNDNDKAILNDKITVWSGSGTLIQTNREERISFLAKLLYKKRSEFVHQAKLVADFNGGITIGLIGDKIVKNVLSMEEFQKVFERGLITYFRAMRKR